MNGHQLFNELLRLTSNLIPGQSERFTIIEMVDGHPFYYHTTIKAVSYNANGLITRYTTLCSVTSDGHNLGFTSPSIIFTSDEGEYHISA